MHLVRRYLACCLLVILLAMHTVAQNSRTAGSPIHVLTCKIEKVSDCLSQETTSGYVAVRVAATIMDRPRASKGSSPGFGIWRSEDPVLVTRKSNNVGQQTVAIIDDLAKRERELNQAGATGMRFLPNHLEHVPEQKEILESQVSSAYNQRELESKLNELANQGYSPVLGGVLPINANKFGDREMVAPPERVQLIVGRVVTPQYSSYKVVEAFHKNSESEISSALQDSYEFVDFVGTANSSFIIMGKTKQAAAVQ